MKTLITKQEIYIAILLFALGIDMACAANSSPQKRIHIGVAQLPVLSEDHTQGLLVGLIQRLTEEMDENQLDISVYPMKRSLFMLSNDKVDVHLPFIYAPDIDVPGVRFSQLTLYKVPFVLATNTNKPPVSVDSLDRNSVFYRVGLRIETAYAHAQAFSYPMRENLCMECALKKLAHGRIDGVVFAAKEVEKIVASNAFTNVKVENYQLFDVKFLIRDTPQGAEHERVVSELFRKMHKGGTLQAAMGELLNYNIRGFDTVTTNLAVK